MRRFTTILAAAATVLAALAPAAHAEAQGGGANNVVLVTTTADGSSLGRSGLQTASVGGSTLASSNIADAAAHDCTGCRSVAVAVQAIYNTGNPSTFVPTNAAVATNSNCTGCGSFAFAYQYVVSTGGPVRLSPTGVAELGALRAEMADVADSGLPFDQLNARLEELAAEFKADVDRELVAAGKPAAGTVRQQTSISPGG